MQVVSCSNDAGMGVMCNFGYIENSAYAFAQIRANPALVWQSIMVSIACFNVSGITTSKISSASQRATIDSSCTLLIWILSCLTGMEVFHPEAILGFVMLTMGTLVYNEAVVISCCGLDQNTNAKLAAARSRDEDDDYKRADKLKEKFDDSSTTLLLSGSAHSGYSSQMMRSTEFSSDI